MKVLERATMPDGTEIQLEEWKNKLYIGAYPLARRSGKYILMQEGEKFRLTICSKKPFSDFKALQEGNKILEDLSNYFWNGKKDMWYLGMNVVLEI